MDVPRSKTIPAIKYAITLKCGGRSTDKIVVPVIGG